MTNMKKVYDTIYSLGTNCRPKGAMRDAMLGCRRGPFDWMKAPSVTFISNTLKSNFSNFFLLENISVVPSETPNLCEVTDSGTGLISVHDFPRRDEDLFGAVAESHASFQKKYQGIIAAFLRDLAALENVLFVLNLQFELESDGVAICPKTNIAYAEIIREILVELTRLRNGKPFDLFIGTYHEELKQLEWPPEVKLFFLDRSWKPWAAVEESVFWIRMLDGVDVKDDEMRNGWPETDDIILAAS